MADIKITTLLAQSWQIMGDGSFKIETFLKNNPNEVLGSLELNEHLVINALDDDLDAYASYQEGDDGRVDLMDWVLLKNFLKDLSNKIDIALLEAAE